VTGPGNKGDRPSSSPNNPKRVLSTWTHADSPGASPLAVRWPPVDRALCVTAATLVSSGFLARASDVVLLRLGTDRRLLRQDRLSRGVDRPARRAA